MERYAKTPEVLRDAKPKKWGGADQDRTFFKYRAEVREWGRALNERFKFALVWAEKQESESELSIEALAEAQFPQGGTSEQRSRRHENLGMAQLIQTIREQGTGKINHAVLLEAQQLLTIAAKQQAVAGLQSQLVQRWLQPLALTVHVENIHIEAALQATASQGHTAEG